MLADFMVVLARLNLDISVRGSQGETEALLHSAVVLLTDSIKLFLFELSNNTQAKNI